MCFASDASASSCASSEDAAGLPPPSSTTALGQGYSQRLGIQGFVADRAAALADECVAALSGPPHEEERPQPDVAALADECLEAPAAPRGPPREEERTQPDVAALADECLEAPAAPRGPRQEESAQPDFRRRHLQKLACSKDWVPQAHRSPTVLHSHSQTVTIFDWDDTLLCTSWLHAAYEADEATEGVLRQIAHNAKLCLEQAIKAGHTYIITNAGSGWVEHSAARWVPELLPTLRQVRVISARDRFAPSYPDEVRQWKIQAFLEVQRQLDATLVTNLVVLGDADYEIEAARIMGDECEAGMVKTVRFQARPEPSEHLKQLELVARNLEKIMGSARSLKVVLARRR